MDASYCPLSTIIEPTTYTLPTGQIKTLCVGKGLIEGHFAVQLKRQQRIVTRHYNLIPPRIGDAIFLRETFIAFFVKSLRDFFRDIFFR
jgi:hypothetical protein